MGINYTDCYWKQIYEPLTLGANHNNFNYTKGSISHVKTFQILPFLLSYFKSGQNYKVLLKTQDGVEGYFPSSEIPPPYMHTAKPSLAGITFISSSWRNFWRAVLLLSLERATLCKNGLVNLLLGKGARAAPSMCLSSASSARTKVPVVQETSTTAQAFQSEHPAEDHQAAGDVHRPAKLHILHIRWVAAENLSFICV